MSEKLYSLAAVDAARLPALRGALVATIPHDELKIKLGVRVLKSEDVDAALRNPKGVALPLHFIFKTGARTVTIELSATYTILSVEIEADDPKQEERLHDLVRDTLALQPPSDEERRGVASLPYINNVLWAIYDKVERLETAPTGHTQRRLRCFISFRFDDHGKALALELREFLELVDVEFVSGLGFEPRSVSEKVLARLGSSLDLFIIIHSVQGDSAWLNQEIGVARGRNLPIVVLREGDVPYDAGMLGDTEYIQFPDNSISKAYVPLLQAIRFVREERHEGRLTSR